MFLLSQNQCQSTEGDWKQRLQPGKIAYFLGPLVHCRGKNVASISEKGKRRVVNMSCSTTACGWMTGRERSHSDSNQLTDKLAVSHSSGYVIVESALRSHRARLSSLSSSIRERNMSSCHRVKNRGSRRRQGSQGLQKTELRDLQLGSAVWCK